MKIVKSGAISVSTVSQVQSYVRAQAKENGLVFSLEDKKAVLQSVEGFSKKQTEKVLATLCPEHPLPIDREVERPINASETEIKFMASDGLLAKLKRIEDLMAHTNWNPSYAELLDRMAEIVLDKIDPVRVQSRMDLRKNSRNKNNKSKSGKNKSDSWVSVKPEQQDSPAQKGWGPALPPVEVREISSSDSLSTKHAPQKSLPPVEVKQTRYISPENCSLSLGQSG